MAPQKEPEKLERSLPLVQWSHIDDFENTEEPKFVML